MPKNFYSVRNSGGTKRVVKCTQNGKKYYFNSDKKLCRGKMFTSKLKAQNHLMKLKGVKSRKTSRSNFGKKMSFSSSLKKMLGEKYKRWVICMDEETNKIITCPAYHFKFADEEYKITKKGKGDDATYHQLPEDAILYKRKNDPKLSKRIYKLSVMNQIESLQSIVKENIGSDLYADEMNTYNGISMNYRSGGNQYPGRISSQQAINRVSSSIRPAVRVANMDLDNITPGQPYNFKKPTGGIKTQLATGQLNDSNHFNIVEILGLYNTQLRAPINHADAMNKAGKYFSNTTINKFPSDKRRPTMLTRDFNREPLYGKTAGLGLPQTFFGRQHHKKPSNILKTAKQRHDALMRMRQRRKMNYGFGRR